MKAPNVRAVNCRLTVDSLVISCIPASLSYGKQSNTCLFSSRSHIAQCQCKETNQMYTLI